MQLDRLTPRESADRIVAWLAAGDYKALNVAGPRESKRPGVYATVIATLDACVA